VDIVNDSVPPSHLAAPGVGLAGGGGADPALGLDARDPDVLGLGAPRVRDPVALVDHGAGRGEEGATPVTHAVLPIARVSASRGA
jgi:hypothetical protein